MPVLILHCRFGEIDALSAELYECGTEGIEEIEMPGGLYELRAYFETSFDATALPGYQGWVKSALEMSTGSADELPAWQSHWRPVSVGHRLWLAPEWDRGGTPEGRLRVNIRPGQGSGTSLSVPTLLMIVAMEEVIEPDDILADIGTGSGILLSAAHALGARRLFGCDIDQQALSAAAESLRLDGIGSHLWCGSPRSLSPGSVSLAVANINAIQLLELKSELLRILAPKGRLLIGGFTGRNRTGIEAAFGPPLRTLEREGWLAFLYQPTSLFESAA